jgi:hypothetical protein
MTIATILILQNYCLANRLVFGDFDFETVERHFFVELASLEAGFFEFCEFGGIYAKPHGDRNIGVLAYCQQTIFELVAKIRRRSASIGDAF